MIPADPTAPTFVLSDHQNLERFSTTKQLSRRQFRWYEILSQFAFRIFHRPGRLSGKPDTLSRRPDFAMNEELRSTNYLQLFTKINASQISVIQTSSSWLRDIKSETESSNLLSQFRDGKLNDDWSYKEQILYYNDLIVLPTEKLQLFVFKQRHCSPVAGHYGISKTIELITRDYYWPKLRSTLRLFIRNCDVCSRAKSSRHAPHGLLQALPVPSERWWDISMDFITDLPPSSGFDSIFVVKDRLSKQAHFLPCKKTISGQETAELFLKEIFRLHGSPRSIISDRGTQFNSHFWKRFQELLGTKILLSSAFHPQTDGSSEVTNQVIEQYLRIFINHQQDDWVLHLPLAEFTYNNSENSSTNMTPFFANHGHHPIFDVTLIRETMVPEAERRILDLKNLNEDLQANLRNAVRSYTEQANKSRIDFPNLNPGDLVFLDRRNLKTTRSSKKLDHKKFGPFKIKRKINQVAYELVLPKSMKVHPVFHVSLLEPKSKLIVPALQEKPPTPEIIEDQEHYEVESILDSRLHRNWLQYLVHWKGFDPSEDTWEPAVSVQEDIPDLVSEFHLQYPFKPNAPRVRSQKRG